MNILKNAMEILITIIVAIAAFIATNLDDIFILMSFYILDDNRAVNVTLGQYLGFIVLLVLSLSSYYFKYLIPTQYIAILGLFPIIIGIKHLKNYRKNISTISMLKKEFDSVIIEKKYINGRYGFKKILQTASVTVANGGDNIAVYIPLFLTLDVLQLGITTITFLLMLGVWCVLGYKMVNNRFFGEKIRIYGHLIFPGILIVIGAGIVLRNLPIHLG